MDGTLARALLGVPTHATTELIRRAFRVAAFDAHPDQGGDDLLFRQLVAARDLLLAAAVDDDARLLTGATRLARAAAAAPTSTIDVVDVVRPRPAHVDPTKTVDTTFDEVLAEVLAA